MSTRDERSNGGGSAVKGLAIAIAIVIASIGLGFSAMKISGDLRCRAVVVERVDEERGIDRGSSAVIPEGCGESSGQSAP